MLDCTAGPASINAELTAGGYLVTSCDSLYSLTTEEMRSRVEAAYDTMVANVRTGAPGVRLARVRVTRRPGRGPYGGHGDVPR
jgi:acetaldehyde dehydrogenase (acetylating)